jgi:predicted transcriptional regulator
MTPRRPMGALEDHVMLYLWAVGAPASPSEVNQAVAPELAYTTVTTVLTRLWEKGRVERSAKGRSFAYSPVLSEAEHRADAMTSTLGAAADRAAVLSTFVDTLDAKDLAVLRDLLEEDS